MIKKLCANLGRKAFYLLILKKLLISCLFVFLLLIFSDNILASDSNTYSNESGSSAVSENNSETPQPNHDEKEENTNGNMVSLSVRGASINDVLMMLTEQSGINLVPDDSVQGQVTIDLKNVDVLEAMRTLTIAYGYNFDMISDNIFLVSREPYIAPPVVKYKDGLLTLQVEEGNVRKILNEISELTGLNIVMNLGVQGDVSANLKKVPLEEGLLSFLQANGFSISKSNNIYRIISNGHQETENLAISVNDGLVSMDVRQADLAEVLRSLSRLGDINMVLFSGVRDVVDLKIDNISIEDTIDILLSGTRFSYRYVDDIYLVGDKNPGSPGSSLFTLNKTIPIEYLKVENVPQLLPHDFPGSNVKVLKEQNSLMVTGTQSEIDYLENYIKKIDTEIPLIVVEALILELNENESESPEVSLGMEYEGNDTTLFDSVLGKLTYKSVIDLPADFYFKVNSLVSNNQATIKARPNITTLNGKKASIDVGTVQYYRVIDTDSNGDDTTRYQSVSGGVNLEVTPWVSSSGEITLELNPTVSNIGAVSSDDGPPQISRRTLNTTVRVKDGQTVVIGGLIQDIGTEKNSKVPVLGDLPILGGLFRSSSSDIHQTELIMYITPRVLNISEDFETEMDDMEASIDDIYEKNR